MRFILICPTDCTPSVGKKQIGFKQKEERIYKNKKTKIKIYL